LQNERSPRAATVAPICDVQQQMRVAVCRHTQADNAIALLQVLTTLAPLALLWWLAYRTLSVSYWLTAAVILVISLFTLRIFALMHDCGHGSLFRTNWLNRAFGFFFGVLSGMPQYVWSQHHNFHHANNGNWDKYRGPLTTLSVGEYAALSKLQQRVYRYVRTLGMAPFGGFLYLIFNPRFTWLKGSIELLWHILRKTVTQPTVSMRARAASFETPYWQSWDEYWHMFWNNMALLGAWALMVWVFGAAFFFIVYLSSVSLAGGAGIVLFTVQHNFEHSYASDTERWDYFTGAIKGSSLLELPSWLHWFTADIAYHHVHHLSARIPNYRLVKCHSENLHLFKDVTRIKLSSIPRASKCILWDTAAQRIISVAEYLRQTARATA
jgi:omega-6 fatty acid desaturase (delta-12 desaturase)